jgi:primosomal protein N' (replication factor Y)
MRVIADFNRRKMTGYVISLHNNAPSGFEIKDIISVIDETPIFDGKLIDLVHYVSDSYLSSIGEALSKALPSGESTNLKYRAVKYNNSNKNSFTLTEEQHKVFSEIKKEPEGVHLIFGVTGSGKTEIYINIAQDVIKSGRSVIYLVPEITLSSQIFDRLQRTFGEELVLYHSGLTQNQRLANWKKFQSGEAKIAVGTRSSVFLQAPDLGLIIIDE